MWAIKSVQPSPHLDTVALGTPSDINTSAQVQFNCCQDLLNLNGGEKA